MLVRRLIFSNRVYREIPCTGDNRRWILNDEIYSL
jgi:hypothetical protein